MFAGPNGSGKSTINQRFLQQIEFDGPYVNADEIAKTLIDAIPDRRERDVAAAEIATAQRLACLAAGTSFAFETVMSTPEKVALLTQARELGYEVTMVFVTTSDPDINVARVANRVALGGHPVPEGSIRSRYEACMKLLPAAIEQADHVVVFDNSHDAAREDRAPLVVAQKEGRMGPLKILDDSSAPEWVNARLQKDWNARVVSLADLAAALQREGHKSAPVVLLAEARDGLRYTGRMVAVTSVHLLQELKSGRFLVHARELLQDRAFNAGGVEQVGYAYQHGKTVSLDRSQDR